MGDLFLRFSDDIVIATKLIKKQFFLVFTVLIRCRFKKNKQKMGFSVPSANAVVNKALLKLDRPT